MPQKLAKFSDTIEKDEQQNLLKRFCQSGIDWLKEFPSTPTNNCETEKRLTMCKMLHGINFNETTLFTPIRNSKSLITFDDFYNALNQMPFLKKVVISAQNRIEMFEKNANFIDGDYTWLVCTQIKLIERYLKLVILHNPDWRIYKTKNSALCTNNNNEFVTLTPSNDARLIDVESGGLICGLQYHYFQNNTNTYSTNLPWFLKGYYYNRNRNVTREFFPQRDTVVTTNCPLYLSFTQGFRNGFFHTEPVKDFETAKNISKGVAYWLACCMKHYSVVHDIEI